MKENPENFSPSEGEDATQKKKAEDYKKMNRREFLAKAAMYGGALAAGAFIGHEINKEGEKEEEAKEHLPHGEGVIIEKIDNPARTAGGGTISVGHSVISMAPNTIPESFQIRVKVNGKEYAASVSREEFETLSVGEKVSLKYDDRDMTASSIRKAE